MHTIGTTGCHIYVYNHITNHNNNNNNNMSTNYDNYNNEANNTCHMLYNAHTIERANSYTKDYISTQF